MDKVYIAIDLKSFYASVECKERNLDPLTTNLVVADSSRTSKTICLAVSPSLKSYGIPGRARLYEVEQKVKEININRRKQINYKYFTSKSTNNNEIINNPYLELDFIIAKPRMKLYMDYSNKIYNIYLKYISKEDILVYSVDEVFCDITDYLKYYNKTKEELVMMIIKDVYESTGITATAGIGTNMYLAKIALDITAKSSKDRIGWLNEEKFIRELSLHEPITDFWRISTGTKNRLLKYGIKDMEGIRRIDEEILYKEFGVNAEIMIDHAYGIEPVTMADIKGYKSKSKSISSHEILTCGYYKKDALIVLKEMIQNGCYNLYLKNLATSSIHIAVNYVDFTMNHATISYNICTNLYKYLIDDVIKAYERIVLDNKEIKAIGYSFGVTDIKNEHYDIFTDLADVEKEKKLLKSILTLKDKYGKNSVLKALDIDEKATIIERNKMIGGHNSGEDE